MKTLLALTASLIIGAALFESSAAQGPPAGAPSYTSDGRLIRPSDYREWIFVSSGMGMTYGPAQPSGDGLPFFDNVFVTPAAYREFLRSGVWPDGTMFVLEIRRAEANVSINKGGRTQGDIVSIEASVKDRQRFGAGGWAYFTFGNAQRLAENAAPLAANASCYTCHAANTAVDNTFVQFYPTLFETARRLGTVKADFDPSRKP
jgi:hypothetical protein